MSEDDLKSVIATYQSKSFELFNSNIVFETQIHTLRRQVESLIAENNQLKAQIDLLNTQEVPTPKKTTR
jgi:cell division protein FtsB